MISNGLNILAAVAMVLGGTSRPCSHCALRCGTPAGCPGMEASHSGLPCDAGFSGADCQPHRCCNGPSISGIIADRTAAVSDSAANRVAAAGFALAPAHLVAADRLAEISREESSRGGVFRVLDGSSIPTALHHLLF
jgi:hypothetical protein